MPIISVHDLTVTIQEHTILDHLTFDIAAGEITAIIGPNGAGKTTLLKTLLGLLPYQGTIRILDTSPQTQRAVGIAYVPQFLEFDRTVPLTVTELLSIYAVEPSTIAPSLEAVGAEKLLKKRIGSLSGGEFQRVLIALSLLNDPKILFLDEPVSGVDSEGAIEVYDLITQLNRERQMTIVLVSHDLDVVFRHANQVICINKHLLCHGIPRETLTPEQLAALYGSKQTFYFHEQHTD